MLVNWTGDIGFVAFSRGLLYVFKLFSKLL